MARASGSLLRQLHRLAATPVGTEPSDRQLLRHYAASRDEAVFEVLVRRHAALVWGVCRRLLTDEHDAEDAFQATFLVLLRKADAVRFQESVAGWLHTVACRVARKARVAAARRRFHEGQAEVRPGSDPLAAVEWQDLREVLDEELGRLPAKYRAPVVLCHLEGLTYAEAARRLGWPEGTVSGRLARAREKLRTRLAGRGVVLSVGALTAALAHPAAAPPALVAAAQRLAVVCALGEATADSSAAALAQGVLRTMRVAKLTAATALALAVLSAGALGYRLSASSSQPESPAAIPGPAPANQQPKADLFGDPLPPGALFRMGTVRLRQPYPLIAFSPDGKTLISVKDPPIRTWDLGTGRYLGEKRFEGTQDLALHALGFAADGKTLLEWEFKRNLLFVYDVPTGKQLGSISVGDKFQAYRAALAPGGKAVAASVGGEGRQRIRLWDLATGTERQLLEHNEFESALAFSPDGKLLGAAGRDGGLRLWDVTTGKLLYVLAREEQAESVAFSPNGQMVASGGNYGTVEFWDLATGKEQAAIRGAGIGTIQTLAFSPDGKRIAAGGQAGLALWDVAARKEQFRKDPQSKYRSGNAQNGLLWLAHRSIQALTFAPDGRTLAACGDSTIRLWDVGGGKELLHRPGHEAEVRSLAVSPDGRIVASNSRDTLCLWDGSTGRLLHQVSIDDMMSPSLTSDGRLVACGGRYDDLVHLWETATGKERRRFSYRDFQPENRRLILMEVHLSPDGKRLVALIREDVGSRFHLAIWDTDSGKLLGHRSFQARGWASLTRDASGVTVLVPDERGKPNRPALRNKEGDDSPQMLAIEDTVTGKRLLTFPGVEDLPLDFSPDGTLMAVVRREPVTGPLLGPVARGNEVAIGLAEVATGREVVRLETWPVDQLAFSPDGRLLATAGYGIVRLWEVITGKEISTWRRHEALPGAPPQAGVSSLALLPGGRGLATGLADGTILVWDITPEGPTSNQTERLWTDLGTEDARKAYRAVHALAASPTRTIAYLKQHLQPVPELDAKHVAQLIAELDSERFAVRSAATKELATLGERVLPALRQALQDKPSLEARQRLERLLVRQRVPPSELLRVLRAVWVLERIGTPEALQIVQQLASGAMAPQTRAAREALERLAPGLRRCAGL
jgi:RNA polymerase sigma factor (sigma-70 family)